MDELREAHLGPAARRRPRPRGPSVGERLRAAYEEVVARRAASVRGGTPRSATSS